jgi:transposase-like protein
LKIDPRHDLVDPHRERPYLEGVGRRLQTGQPAGAQHPRARLTEDDVRAIRARLEAGDRQVDIARDYDLDPSHVSHIAAGRTWAHLGPPIKVAKLRGSQRKSAKLTEDDIPAILSRIERGASLIAVARAFGVGRTTISDIWHGRRWTHVPRPATSGPRRPVYEEAF